jgi:hypothetical protein
MIGAGSAQVAADGTFVFRNLFDGNYRVVLAGHTEEFYLKSASLGGSDVLDSSLSLTDTEGATLEIELSQNGGSLSVTVVQDQKVVPGVMVALVPDPPKRQRNDLYRIRFTDQFGRLNMVGLPPGDYKVFAWDSSSGVDVQEPEFLKTYEDRGKSVHIEEKNRQSIQVDLIALKDNPN